jgi:hypothetical protein
LKRKKCQKVRWSFAASLNPDRADLQSLADCKYLMYFENSLGNASKRRKGSGN